MKVKFDLNCRHVMNVDLNAATGRCDVVVCDRYNHNTFTKSLLLEQYNKLVDWFKENDGAFSIMAAKSIFQ